MSLVEGECIPKIQFLIQLVKANVYKENSEI